MRVKTFKVKLHPTKEQEKYMCQTSFVARWAYNWVFGRQKENSDSRGTSIQDGKLRKKITQLKKKKEFSWFSDVSAQIPKQAVKDACNA